MAPLWLCCANASVHCWLKVAHLMLGEDAITRSSCMVTWAPCICSAYPWHITCMLSLWVGVWGGGGHVIALGSRGTG